MDLRLRKLLDTLPEPPQLPAPWPQAGQPESAWLAEVDAQRLAFEQRSVVVAEGPPVAAVRDLVVEDRFPVRVYVPEGEGPFPAVVVLHGGGFWLGGGPAGLAAADPGMREMCTRVGCVVVNVDYREAPRHRFPAAVEDAWSATAWAAGLPEVDGSRVALSGASAGGNLAAGVALLARTRGPALRLQQLLVPTLDATQGSASVVENAIGTDLTAADVARCWDLYLGPDGDPRHELASPLLAAELSGLPPAHIVVAEHDPLRDDGLRYAERLRAAGIAVVSESLPMTHGIALPEVGAAYVASVVAELRKALFP